MFQNISEEIIKKALTMYMAKGTRYLKQAQISKSDDTIDLNANFSIKECCYSAPNVSHFNAVEAIICLNQMFYVTLLGGHFVKDETLNDFAQYWPKVYILEFEKVRFRKLIDSTYFYGKLTLKPLHKMGDNMYYEGWFAFGNDKDCKSFIGRVKGCLPIL